jgi:hypothetical protein
LSRAENRALLVPRSSVPAATCRHRNAAIKQTVDDSDTALENAARSSYVPILISPLASDPALSGEARLNMRALPRSELPYG